MTKTNDVDAKSVDERTPAQLRESAKNLIELADIAKDWPYGATQLLASAREELRRAEALEAKATRTQRKEADNGSHRSNPPSR